MAPRFWLAVLVVSGVLVRPAHNFVAPPPRVAAAAHAAASASRQRAPAAAPPSVCHLRRCAGIEAASAAAAPMMAEATALLAGDAEREVITIEQAPKMGVLRKLWAVKRTLYIWSSVVGHALQVAMLRRRQNFGMAEQALVEARTRMAASLRDTLIRLGPTFIKIGQLMSTRVDVLPPEVIKELSQLQNEVPGFPAKRALKIIQKELGQSVDQLFQSFDVEPLAAASLAQVHRAVLRTGEEVVVKVQRENLLDLFAVDLWNIRLVAWLADRLDPQTEATAANWKAIADTSGDVLYREVDFNIERRAAEEFADNFAKHEAIKVPRTYRDLSSSKVMTMEYCPGVKISDSEALAREGFDPVHLAAELTNSYLEQVCRHGFFHCDPHPGNLAVDHGYPGGRIVYYDFGMMEVMEPEVKKGFVDLIFSIYENLPREACDALEAMGVLRTGVDRTSIERIARNMLSTFQSTLSSADNKWENEMTPEEKRAARRARRAKLGQDLFATQAEKPFLLPPKWTFVFRAFSTIDGIGKVLHPGGYDLTRISQPYLRELANLRDGSTTTTAIKEVGRRLGLRPKDIAQAVGQPRAVAALAESVRRIEEGDVKLRVRTLEVERALERMEERQQLVGNALGAGLLLELSQRVVGVSQWFRLPFYLACAKLGLDGYMAWGRMHKLEMQRRRFSNDGETMYDDVDVYSGDKRELNAAEDAAEDADRAADGTNEAAD